jgi:hypothetical protein
MNHKKIGELICKIDRLGSEKAELESLLNEIHTGKGIARTIGRLYVGIQYATSKTPKQVDIPVDLVISKKDYRGEWEIDTHKEVEGTQLIMLGLRKNLQGRIDQKRDLIAKAKHELSLEAQS